MKVFAPGKLVLTGAYVVLEGAPAIVVATSRGAVADTSRHVPTPTIEVRAALGDGPYPHVDASSLFVGARKLGLGASAAILVATLAARDADAGALLHDAAERDALFARARKAHAEAQGGGSGVDVAASVYGGTLHYVPGEPRPAALPRGTVVTVLACATSARTSELREIVDRFASSAPAAHRARMDELGEIAREALAAVEQGERARFVAAVRLASTALDRLGKAASAPIVPPGFDTLAREAEADGAAFCVSGAGGGDVAAYVGSARPTEAFLARARALGLFVVDLDLDTKGVRIVREAAPLGASHAALNES